MNIAVTGATGVLGKILCDKLKLQKGINLHTFGGDITEQSEVENWANNTSIDYLFHFAALVAVDVVNKEPFKAYNVNVGGTIHLLNAIHKSGQKPWIFYASTSHVYKSSDSPINEEYTTEPINIYGTTKLAAEKVCESFAKSYDYTLCTGRIFSFYHSTQKMPFLYPTIVNRLATEDMSKPFKLRGAACVRDIMNAEDIIEVILKLQNKKYSGLVNIASGKGVTIKDFVKQVAGKDIEIEPLDNDYNCLVADINKLQKAISND